MEISGRAAVVTGGASGIGQAVARRIYADGGNIIIFDLNAEAGAMHLEIKAALTDQYPELRVIYGGSVKPENCAAFTMAEGIDGLLVGGASLSAESFWNICASAKGAG